MKNLAIIATVAWLLFFNGFSTLRGLAGNSTLSNAPQTIIQGAARVVQTVQPAAQPRPAQQVNASRPLIQVERMPVLPTATPQPEPTAEVVELPLPATPIVFVARAADCIPRPASDPCWLPYADQEAGAVTGASPDCYPLPADDPCWKGDD